MKTYQFYVETGNEYGEQEAHLKTHGEPLTNLDEVCKDLPSFSSEEEMISFMKNQSN